MEDSEKEEEEEKDAAISETHPTATHSQTVTTRETAQTHDKVIPEKEINEEDASTAVGIEPNTASEATPDDPPHGEQAVVSAVQAIAAPLAAAETGSRITTSPPCEVSSTTSCQGLEETAAPLPPAAAAADDDKKVHRTTATAPRLVEGVIADSNNEKVLFEEEEEDDEIDDVEPAVSAPEEKTLETAAASSPVCHPDPLEASSGAPNSEETERVLDPPQIVSSDPHPDPVPEVDHLASDAASAVEGGSLEAAALVNSGHISISVVDRTAVQAADRVTEEGGGEGGVAAEQKLLRKHHATTLDEVEDVSVTMVERKKRRPSSSPDRTTEKRRREEEDAVTMIDSRLMRVEADATAVTDHHHHPEPIVTISKVSAVKAAAAPAASPGPTDATAAAARRTPVSSPSAVQQPNTLQPPAAGTYSMFAQRMRGGGAQHLPPRPGGLMMIGHHPPPRGFLMRGGFRGGGLRGAGTLPSLQPRPPLGGPMSLPPAGGFPSAAAGPVAEQLNRVAGRLADYMKHSLEDLFRDLSSQVGLQRQCCVADPDPVPF